MIRCPGLAGDVRGAFRAVPPSLVGWGVLLWLGGGCGDPEPADPPEPAGWERCALGEVEACRAAEDSISHGRACALGEGEACWDVGLRARWASVPRSDEALLHWGLGCRAGHLPSCAAAADLRMAEGAFESAGVLSAVGCEGGSPLACSIHGEARLLVEAEVACAEGQPEACGLRCARGSADCERAVPGMRQRCEEGDAVACTWLGTAAAGGRVAADADQANRWLWLGCDLDDPWGCLRLAHRVRHGVGHNPSPKSEAWLFTQVCDLQLDLGCAPHAPGPVSGE